MKRYPPHICITFFKSSGKSEKGGTALEAGPHSRSTVQVHVTGAISLLCTTAFTKCVSAVARGGAGGPGPPNNYGGNKSINRLEVATDQCGAFDLDFFFTRYLLEALGVLFRLHFPRL